MQQIPYCEVKFHPHSFADHRIRLFRWNGQIYRGISVQLAPFFQKLFQDGIIGKVTEQGLLIESEVTHLGVNGYDMVVRHKYIPFIAYPNEWCAAMLKDAALNLIELGIELAQHGLTLADAHPWNLLYDIELCKPVFVDLGSISPIYDSTWAVYDEFCRFCLYPLILISSGQAQIGRLLMCEDQGVLKSDLLTLTQGAARSQVNSKQSLFSQLELVLRQRVPRSYRQQIKKTLISMRSLFRQQSDLKYDLDFLENIKQKTHLDFFIKLKQEIESITLPCFKAEGLDDDKKSISFSPEDDWSAKQRNLHKILTDLQPNSVLDIGCGTGWYSKLAAIKGSKVIAFDTNEACVTQLYYDACKNKLPILPLIMDFSKPTPSRGLSKHWAIAAKERLQCDMVLALAVVHQIVLERRLNFVQIAKGLAQFSQRWVVVEFIPREDTEVVKQWSEKLFWYTLDNFYNALKKQFRSVITMPSHPEPRVLLLCEK